MYKAKSIALWDDNFIEDKEYASKVLEELIRLKFCLPISVEARADSVDLQILSLLKKAGGDFIAYGFESGSQRILDYVKKGI